MADINVSHGSVAPDAGASPRDPPAAAHLTEIELLFFAYRDFIGDPDAMLAALGFGRAHHRVLYFVWRKPGMTVAELLDILKITKQSLARVLRDLIDGGYIHQQTGPTDRRQRLLHTTDRGAALVTDLVTPQSRRIAAALAGLDASGRASVRAFLAEMINPADRPPPGRLL